MTQAPSGAPASVIEPSQKHENPSPCHKAVSIAKNRPKAKAVIRSSANSRPELFNCSPPESMTTRESGTAAVTRRVHPRRRCGRVAPMAKNSGLEDWGWRLPRPAAALAATAFLLSLTGSQPARAQIDPFGWFEQLFQPN